jgi:hypothetical protein
MAVTESNIYALWAAKQAAKGTPVADAAAVKRFRQVGGDLNVNPSHGSENFSDLDRFGDAADFVDSIGGGGAPVLQATPNELAYLNWLFFGTEVFTAKVVSTSAPKFVFEPGSSTGFWSSWWKRVGQSEIVRQKFNDCKISSLRFEGSSANKIVKVTPTIISLDPGQHKTADPTGTASLPTQAPFLFTEGEGAFTIDGGVFRGASQFAIVVDNGDAPYFGDAVLPIDLVPGNARITLESITMVLDSDSRARYNSIVYGTPTPAADAKPSKTIPALGSYQFELARNATDTRESFKLEIPKVRWSPDLAIAPSPDGGPVEIALAGEMRKQTATPKSIRITIETGSGDNAAHT